MKIKAKHIFLVGAFIVLTLIGYIVLPKDEIVINLDSEEDSGVSLEDSDNIENKKLIYVHIEGAVNSPGVKEVEIGTRLFELIELADGELADADLSKVNLASVLKDEQKVYVPYKIIIDESVESSSNDVSNNSSISTNNINIGNINSENLVNNNISSKYTESININTATSDELQKLEGIGPSMAKKILDYRDEKGYFSSIDEIKNVSGIGESKYNKIKDYITI